MIYVEVIKAAVIFFPFIALLFTLPYVLVQYHRYGSVSYFKSLVVYSFVFYLLCAYFLVILPLPTIEEVAQLTTERYQIIPFNVIRVWMQCTTFNMHDIHTYLPSLKDFCFIQPFFNIVLTIPFGMYLHYLFNLDFKKTLWYSFLFSLFFELTQLTGLYFIYPRSYRLFDVDDLILNSLGGAIGYWMSIPILKQIPSMEKLRQKARDKAKSISGPRRTLANGIDLFFFILLCLFLHNYIQLLVCFIIYYIGIPMLTKGSTLGEKFLNLRVVNKQGDTDYFKMIIRRLLFVVQFIIIPFGLSYLFIRINHYELDHEMRYVSLIIIMSIFMLYSISGIKMLFTPFRMCYEIFSKTKLESTIK